MSTTETPLRGPPPSEVPLPDAPLVCVIAQVRFPLVASIEKQDFIGSFQESIRRDYPVLRPGRRMEVALGPQHPAEVQSSPVVWRFSDVTSTWRMSLAPDFLALQTAKYSSRDDFLNRFEQALSALREHVRPQTIDRLGL
ncbi:MAG: TIGR04255 family protein, partial [bacterium]|nr:TIGR04255 family protein [bacterium]